MNLTLAAVIALSLLARSSSQEECGCCGLAKELISDSDGPVNISANPFLEGNNSKVDPSQVEISESNTGSQAAWCSVLPPARVAYDPYLKFEFSSTYLIEIIKISGKDAGSIYVGALTIKNDTGQGYAFINDNGIPKVFYTRLMNASDVRNISFIEEPILATSLQIRPLNWTSNSPCMRIELYGCLYNNSQNSHALTNNTDGDLYPKRGVLITLGIGAGFAGSLVTIVIILAAVGIVCCYRLIKKREFRRPKERSSSMDSDATLRVVNNILYRKRGSDRRPLAPSTASTLVYETVPGEQDSNSKETAKPKDGENMEEQRYTQETPYKQQSATATPIYEIQYEPVKIDEGLCVIREEAGEEVDEREQCKLRDQLNGPSESNSGTVGSHHSYEIIKNREGEVLEASSESFLDNEQQGRDMDGGDEHTGLGGGVTSTEPKRGGAKKKLHGAKNATYENISIALSPDTRHALFCESSGPQHFAV